MFCKHAQVNGWDTVSPSITEVSFQSSGFSPLNPQSNLNRNIRCNNINYFVGLGSESPLKVSLTA